MALRFIRDAAATQVLAEDALVALAGLMTDRSVDPLALKPGRLDPRRTPRHVHNLLLKAELELIAGHPDRAVETRSELLLFGPDAAGLARLGLALAAAADSDGATLLLSEALGDDLEPDMRGTCRDALAGTFTPERHPRGLGALIVDAARAAEAEAPAFPWEGEVFPLEDLAGPLETEGSEETEESEPPQLLRILTWGASWDPAHEDHLAHVAAVASERGDQVVVGAYAVDPLETAWTRWLGERELPVPVTWQGPGALADLGAVRRPLTVLIGPDGTVLDAIVAQREDDTRLDEAVDAFFGEGE
jgi:hypothetical protein